MSEFRELEGEFDCIPTDDIETDAYNLRFSFVGSIDLGEVEEGVPADFFNLRSEIYAKTLAAVEDCIHKNKKSLTALDE